MLFLTNRKNIEIRTPAKVFCQHRLHIVSCIEKEARCALRHVLVELEADTHPRGLKGDRQDALAGKISSIGNCCRNVFCSQ